MTALYDVLKANTTPATKLALIDEFDKVLSLDITAHAKEMLEEEKAAEAEKSNDPFIMKIEALIEERKNAKKEKNYARADEIRNELTEMGVTLIDTAQGTQYKIG